MSPFLFWIFAVLTVIFGAAVVLNRNPVASALSLVVSFLGLSALFMLLVAALLCCGFVPQILVRTVAPTFGSALTDNSIQTPSHTDVRHPVTAAVSNEDAPRERRYSVR